MTSNDYVSKEVAMLLKILGFDEETIWYYMNEIGNIEMSCYGYDFNHNKFDSELSAPSLQQAFKWIKNKHHIFITIIPSETTCPGFETLTYCIYKITETRFIPIIQIDPWKEGKIEYEDVMNDAIKYILENLETLKNYN